jgi:Right handed beta helix region
MTLIRKVIFGFLLITGLFVITPVQAAILYVDKDNTCPGAGTSASPYCSIQSAFNAAVAGDIVRIRDSATPYDGTFRAVNSGTTNNPIVVEPDVGHNPILRYSSPDAMNGVIELHDVSYWTIRNLTFDGTGVHPSLFAIWIHPDTRITNGIRIEGNTFKNWGGSQAQADDSTKVPTALSISGNSSAQYSNGTVVSRNVFDGNRPSSMLIWLQTNLIVENNEFKNAQCGRYFDSVANALGIHVISGGISSGTIIRNNTFHDWASWSNCTLANQSYATWAAIWCDVGATNGEVSGNVIYNIGQDKSDFSNSRGLSWDSIGIFIEEGCNNWTVKNNLIYNVTTGIRHGGLHAGQQNFFYNNTIYNAGYRSVWMLRGNAVFKNNIFANPRVYNIGVEQAAINMGGITFNYNLYLDNASGNKMGFWGDGVIRNVSGWKTRCGCDGNSLNADPLFVNADAADFHLQLSSPARSAGEGGVDMGAYSYNGSIQVPQAPANLQVVVE